MKFKYVVERYNGSDAKNNLLLQCAHFLATYDEQESQMFSFIGNPVTATCSLKLFRVLHFPFIIFIYL